MPRFQTKLVAIYIAFIIAHDVSETNKDVHNDSLSALLLKAENTKDNTHITTLLLQEAFALRRRGKTIALYSIPSRVGFEGNERADYETNLVRSFPSVTFHITRSFTGIKARGKHECLRAIKRQ